MVFSTKDIILLSVEFLFTLITASFFYFGIFSQITFAILLAFIILSGIIILFQTKLNELSKKISEYGCKINKFEEKFIIHDRLNKLELEVFNGKKRPGK